VTGSLLLDTNIVIGLLANERSVVDRFSKDTGFYIPAIVVGELYFGAYNSGRVEKNLKRINAFLEKSTVLSIDRLTATYFASIRRLLRQKGKPIPENDVWIAALAQQYDLKVATRDDHFAVVDDLGVEFF
jgi:tRNA(fMet)-specific endonuclease VapC